MEPQSGDGRKNILADSRKLIGEGVEIRSGEEQLGVVLALSSRKNHAKGFVRLKRLLDNLLSFLIFKALKTPNSSTPNSSRTLSYIFGFMGFSKEFFFGTSP